MKACIALLFVSGIARAGEVLTAAEAPRDWLGMGVAVLVGGGIVGLVWYLRHNPGTVAKAKAETETLKNSLASVAVNATSAFHNLTQTHAEVIAKQTGAAPPAVDPIFAAAKEAHDKATKGNP